MKKEGGERDEKSHGHVGLNVKFVKRTISYIETPSKCCTKISCQYKIGHERMIHVSL